MSTYVTAIKMRGFKEEKKNMVSHSIKIFSFNKGSRYSNNISVLRKKEHLMPEKTYHNKKHLILNDDRM